MSGLLSTINQVFGLGKVGSNSHPIHPSTVHFPIAFLALGYSLDVLQYGIIHYDPSLLRPLVPYLLDISKASHYSNALGLITAIPAAVTGVSELWAMVGSKGIWQKIQRKSDGETVYSGVNPTVRLGVIHGMLNDVALSASFYNWWTRRDMPGFEASGTNVLLSALMLPSLMFSAFLGGSMVYKYGVGVRRMGEASKSRRI